MLREVQIEHVQVHSPSTTLRFGPGFNLIIGPNNTGKTTILDACQSGAGLDPTRNLETVRQPGTEPDVEARITRVLAVSRRECVNRGILKDRLFLPKPRDSGLSEREMLRAMESAVTQDPLVLRYTETLYPSKSIDSPPGHIVVLPWDPPPEGASKFPVHEFRVQSGLKTAQHRGGRNGGGPSGNPTKLHAALKSRVYRFAAFRSPGKPCDMRASPVLEPDGRNLADCLQLLYTKNRFRWDRYVESVRAVFPEVKFLDAGPVEGNPSKAEVRAWFEEGSNERPDLAFRLDQCGAGLSQVCALLYVVMNSDHPLVLCIDEPTTFLHPGAVRALMDILKSDGGEHQYIISSHSPFLVGISGVDSVHSCIITDGTAEVQQVDVDSIHELRTVLGSLGARPSDLYGADAVVWVEGETEEALFPQVLASSGDRHERNVVFLSVLNTGDFEHRSTKNRTRVVEIYQSLGSGSPMIPSRTVFLFDDECRDQTAREDLKRLHDGVRFLPRRMTENYLLSPVAIASLLTTDDHVVEESEVRDVLEMHRENRLGIDSLASERIRGGSPWIDVVQADRVLSRIFQDLGCPGREYDKREDGFALASWLLDNEAGELAGLQKFLVDILPEDSTDKAS